MVKPNDDLSCPAGTGLVTRIVKRKPQVFCQKGVKGMSSAKCADRSARYFTLTGSEALDAKIIEGIEQQFDLCYHPAGAYFCRENLNVHRPQMPQFKGNILEMNSDIRLFLDELLDGGVKIEMRYVPVCILKATQDQLNGERIRGMIETLRNANGDFTAPAVQPLIQPIIISNDYYVLDGHHRWASLLAWNFLNNKQTVRIHVNMIDLSMKQLYNRAVKSKYATFEGF